MTNVPEPTLPLHLKHEDDTEYESTRTADGKSGIESVFQYLARCREQPQPDEPQPTHPDQPSEHDLWRTRQRKVESILRVQNRLNQRRARLAQAQSEFSVGEKQCKTRKMARRAQKHERLITRDEEILKELQGEIKDPKDEIPNAYHMNPKERQGRRAIIQEHIDYMRELTTSIHAIRYSHESEDLRRNNIRCTIRLARKHLRKVLLYMPANTPALLGLAEEFELAKEQLERAMAACVVVSPLDGIFYRQFPEVEGEAAGSATVTEERDGGGGGGDGDDAEADDWVIVEDS